MKQGCWLDTALGRFWLAGRDGVLTDISLTGTPRGPWEEDPATLPQARRQLTEYADGHRTVFDLPLAPEGTAFQRSVWDALCTIGFGETASYADIAQRIGKPGGTQAVGQANGRNPIPIVIPCHRIIAADGGLGGFSGGAEMKQKLLSLEGTWTPQPRLL